MNAQKLIDCWERGRRRHPLDRALLLHGVAAPGEDPSSLADRTLGERNAALLRLRQSLFGDALKSCIDCPECGERLEFSLSASALLARAPADADRRTTHAQVGGQVLRLPTTRDLASVAHETDADVAARKLLGLLRGAEVPGEASGESPDAGELARAFDAADPCMDIAIELACPACAHAWSADFDVPTFVWEEVEVRARSLLDEVHALARAYGWSESEILALPGARRRAYLERVLG